MGHSIDYLKVQECKFFQTQTLLLLQSVECIFAMPFIIVVGYQIYNKNKGLLLHILVKPLVTLAVSQEFCKLFDLKGRHLMQFCSKILQYNTLLFLVLCQNTKCFCFKNTFSFDDFGRSWIFFIQKIILGGFKNSGKIQKSAHHSTQLMMESVI